MNPDTIQDIINDPGHGYGEWSATDFKINAAFWAQHGRAALPIRERNLVDLRDTASAVGLTVWLQGQTLLGAYRHKMLLDDHDDDVGVWADDWATLGPYVTARLEGMGFRCIRDTQDIVSFERDYRYIDVCLFRRDGRRAGYRNKWFDQRHYASFDHMRFLGASFLVPREAERLLVRAYDHRSLRVPPKFRDLNLRHAVRNRVGRHAVRTRVGRVLEKGPHPMRVAVNMAAKAMGWIWRQPMPHYRRLEEDEFLSLRVEPDDSFNWHWRKPHLDLVTDHGRNRTVAAVVSDLSKPGRLSELEAMVRETDMSTPFLREIHLDKRFWQSGNNYLINNVRYQFRAGVPAYNEANDYIQRSGGGPHLFTAEYYESLDPMSDSDIAQLLRRHPIEVTDGAVTSGKHRVYAMVGRLVAGRPYIPFWAVVR